MINNLNKHTKIMLKRDIVLSGEDGKVIFSRSDVETPKAWSETASLVYAQKYMHPLYENSARQTVCRMVEAWQDSARKNGYGLLFGTDEADRIRDYILGQVFAPNSPQWFNTGVELKYGASSTSGEYYHFDKITQSVVKTKPGDFRSQTHACFILPIEDDMFSQNGIFTHVKKEAQIFKHGSGCGTNFSAIRGRGEPLSGGGESSGLINFLAVFDKAAGVVKSGGRSRRAAKMCVLNDDHPDLFEFIEWKCVEERKARALINQGYSADYEGDAYSTVSGQNSNNSIMLSDAFMEAYRDNKVWELKGRVSGKVKEVKARDLLDNIARCAWECADPGVQFRDTINSWHTCKEGGEIKSSNPCSEYFFLDNTACNLGSLNLLSFLGEDNKFDYVSFADAVRLATIVLDITNDIAKFPDAEIAKESNKYRTIGLGYANLGGLLMTIGVPYDSEEGRDIAALITSLMTAVAYYTSCELASELSPFPEYNANAQHVLKVIERHAESTNVCTEMYGMLEFTKRYWERTLLNVRLYGVRNAQVTAIAPTGTIGLVMDCGTTGVEPDFSLVKYKKLAGGGYMKFINPNISRALSNLGYSKQQVGLIIKHVENNGDLIDCELVERKHLRVFDCATGRGAISVDGHLLMLAAIQPFVSGGISKTINLPNDATVDDIKKCYLDAYKLGLKSVSIYRDGCKQSQPLNKISTEKEISVGGNKRPLPESRNGKTHKIKINGHNMFLRTGEYENGEVGEIFLDMYKEGSTLRSLLNCFAIAVSVGLQHGVPLREFVDKYIFTRFEPAGPVQHSKIKYSTSILDTVFRLLAYEYLDDKSLVHIKQTVGSDGEEDGVVERSGYGDAPLCSTCGSITVRTGTCYGCPVCGTSLGCS